MVHSTYLQVSMPTSAHHPPPHTDSQEIAYHPNSYRRPKPRSSPTQYSFFVRCMLSSRPSGETKKVPHRTLQYSKHRGRAIRHKNPTRGRILGHNWDKSLRSFSPCYSQSPILQKRILRPPPPPPLEQKWFRNWFEMKTLYTETSRRTFKGLCLESSTKLYVHEFRIRFCVCVIGDGGCAGIFKLSVVVRNQVGTGLSYRPDMLQRLAALIPWNRFLGSLKVYKFELWKVERTLGWKVTVQVGECKIQLILSAMCKPVK